MMSLFGRVQQRYVVVVMMFLSMTFTFLLRMSFPIVLTQMVYISNINSSSSINATTESNSELICPVKTHMLNSTTIDPDPMVSFSTEQHERYQWSQKMQGIVLSSFYWGNILSEIPSSILVQRIGPKTILLISITLSAIVTVLTPLAVAYGDFYGLIATRVVLGLVQGPVFPCLAAFIVPWYPVDQRGKLCSIGYIGISAGGALASLLSGILIHYTGRWDVVFYFLTCLLAVWWALFATLCFEQPRSHPFISNSEREYLQRKIEDYENERKQLPPLPWKAMIKSSPVWALALSTGLYSWSFYIINNDLPKYLNDILHVSIEENGIYSSVPKVLSVFISIGSGFVCDLMLNQFHYNRTSVRKIFVVLNLIASKLFRFLSASIVPATFLICASYAGCDELLAVSFLTVSIAGHGFNSAGAAINLFDLSPNYAAPLNAVINTLGTVVGISAPYIAGVLTPNALLMEWRLVFWITFALHMSESVVFTLFGSAKTQAWNSPKD